MDEAIYLLTRINPWGERTDLGVFRSEESAKREVAQYETHLELDWYNSFGRIWTNVGSVDGRVTTYSIRKFEVKD
jgi:hypothetical protein